MHPELEALAGRLEEAVTILQNHGISHWADWLAKDARLIRNHDYYGITHLLSAFGGMGSLNDLVLAGPDTDDPAVPVTAEDDARFRALLSGIHDLATRLSREEGLDKDHT